MGVYSKGAGYERELLELLKKKGFAVVRVAGSGRARMEQPDLIASNGKKTLGIECKYSSTKYKTIKKEEVNSLLKFCEEFGCTAVLAYRFPRVEWKFKIIKQRVDANVNVKRTDKLLSINQVF
jgi:Holliday junction resolvase